MGHCWICHKRLWPWQRRGINARCHRTCHQAWTDGRDDYKAFARAECDLAGAKTPEQLYHDRVKRQDDTEIVY